MSEPTAPAKKKLPVPTGNPWLPTPEDPATVPVPLPVVIVSVQGPYTERDRKLWAFLLHTVWHELGEVSIHEMSVTEINRVFRQLGGDHNTDWIWDCSKRLAQTTVEWHYTDGDARYDGISALFGAEISRTARKTGLLRFNFPPLLVPILKDPRRFARLRTHFLIELSGKYAVTLYELLESNANKDVPELRARVDELRQWLTVPEGKLLRWQDFRRKVLEPAVRQINDNPTGAGFQVKIRLEKEGRAITWVIFQILKTDERKALDARLSDREKQLNLFDAQARLKPDTLEKAKPFAVRVGIYTLESEWRAWGSQQKDWPPRNPDGAFIAFCKKRGPYQGYR